jgi:hypothetical protein
MATVLIDEYRAVIEALQKAGVAFMLVGGVAVIAHRKKIKAAQSGRLYS